jgi:hypothetical protein
MPGADRHFVHSTFEKGENQNEVPAHHNLDVYIEAYIK